MKAKLHSYLIQNDFIYLQKSDCSCKNQYYLHKGNKTLLVEKEKCNHGRKSRRCPTIYRYLISGEEINRSPEFLTVEAFQNWLNENGFCSF